MQIPFWVFVQTVTTVIHGGDFIQEIETMYDADAQYICVFECSMCMQKGVE